MATRRVKVRHIRQILDYRLGKGVSADQTARALKVSKGTVINMLKRFAASGLPWPLPQDITDTVLQSRLYPQPTPTESTELLLPSVGYIEQEMAKKHVTLQCLYDEYAATAAEPVSRASFYRHYRKQRPAKVSMPMEYRGGDLLYVDYSGDSLFYIDPKTGERHSTELFCCCWGLSSYSYAEATQSQNKLDFTQSHVRALRHFGVAPAGVVPDNLKSAVQKASPFDPIINPLYADFGHHYGIAILPARVCKPQDKAKVESGVLHIQRFILARLRNRQFFSLAELNAAIWELLEEFNNRPMKDYGYQNRQERFEILDKPYAQELPVEPFRITDVKHDVLVAKNYHIRYEHHFYSVPFEYATKRVTVRRCGSMVEIVHDNRLLARHLYNCRRYGYSTRVEHMPKAHQFTKGLTPGWILAQAAKVGEHTVNAVTTIMRRSEHQQQGFNAALGILQLAKAFTSERLEAACIRCIHFNTVNYRSLKSVLTQNLDMQPLPPSDANQLPHTLLHENLRRDFGDADKGGAQ